MFAHFSTFCTICARRIQHGFDVACKELTAFFRLCTGREALCVAPSANGNLNDGSLRKFTSDFIDRSEERPFAVRGIVEDYRLHESKGYLGDVFDQRLLRHYVVLSVGN